MRQTVVRQTQRDTDSREREMREKSSVVCDVCRAMGYVCEIYAPRIKPYGTLG